MGKYLTAVIWVVLTTILILLAINKCEREINIIDEERYIELKDSLDILKEKNKKIEDSLKREVLKNKAFLKEIEKQNYALNSTIDSLKSIKHKVPETSVEQVEFFNERYGVDDNVIVGDEVIISSPTSFFIISELLDKDILERTENIKNLVIKNKDTQIELLENNYAALSNILDNTKKELLLTNTILLRAENNIETLQKQLKKSKRDNTLIYSVGIPASLIVGILVGVSLGK